MIPQLPYDLWKYEVLSYFVFDIVDIFCQNNSYGNLIYNLSITNRKNYKHYLPEIHKTAFYGLVNYIFITGIKRFPIKDIHDIAITFEYLVSSPRNKYAEKYLNYYRKHPLLLANFKISRIIQKQIIYKYDMEESKKYLKLLSMRKILLS